MAKTSGQIIVELKALFDAGIPWDEARERVVPVGHKQAALFKAEWKDWHSQQVIQECKGLVFKFTSGGRL